MPPRPGPWPPSTPIATCAIGPTSKVRCVCGAASPPTGGPRSSPSCEAATKDRFEQARKNGDREPLAAYAADALVELLCGDSSSTGRPKTVVNVRVDQEALFNREARGDQVSAIDGFGEVPIQVIESLLSDAYLKVLFYQGTKVNTICHPGRYIDASIRTALINEYPCCAVPGCGSTKFLEIDHIQPVKDNGPVTLSNLVRLCSWHHDQKTNAGYVISKDDHGDWHFDPPPRFGQEPDLGGEPGGGLYDPDRYRDERGGTTSTTGSGTDPPGKKPRRSGPSGRTTGPGRNAGSGRNAKSGRNGKSGRNAKSGRRADPDGSPSLF